MLVLTRRLRERILIGDDIVVEVVDINGGKIQIGIDAPRDISVDREEIAHAKRADRIPGRREPEPRREPPMPGPGAG